MQYGDSPNPARKRWKILTAVFVIACLVMDFFPRYGVPDFRYTGSDPLYAVWNLGWPFALTIYDSRNGFHAGPLVFLVAPFQFFVLSVGWFVALAIRWLRNPPPRPFKAG